MPRSACLLLALGGLLALPARGTAQSPWLGPDHGSRVAIELFKAGFDDQFNVKAASSALFLSGRYRPTAAIAIVGEVPVAFGGTMVYYPNDQRAGTQVGNPYLGMEVGRADGKAWVELGGRLPVIGSEPSSSVDPGQLSDIDRFEAFQPQTTTLSGALNVGLRDSSGLGFRLRAGPGALIATGSGDLYHVVTSVLLYYGAQASYLRGPLELAGHVSGNWNASADHVSFGHASQHQLGIAGSYAVGRVRPGLTFRLPLDGDLQQSLDYVIGISLQVSPQ